MKRAELVKQIAKIAKARGLTVEYVEGGSHTQVRVGTLQTTIPRHREVNEHTARGIIKYLEGEK